MLLSQYFWNFKLLFEIYRILIQLNRLVESCFMTINGKYEEFGNLNELLKIT